MSDAWGPRGRPERCSEELRRDVDSMNRGVRWAAWIVVVMFAGLVLWWGH